MKSKILAIISLMLLGSALNSESLPPVRVLSIDGGGIRGIIPAIVLARLEKELKMPTSEIFDLIVGTSSGGLTAMAMAVPDENNNPMFKATQVVELYQTRAPEIFSASWAHNIETGYGLFGPKYDSVGLRNVVNSFVGDMSMDKAITPIIITGYHMKSQNGVEFSSEGAKIFATEQNCRMIDVAMATSAAPMYFDAANVEYPWGTLEAVIDGGVYKNTPVLVAYMNAKKMFPDREIDIYSLGTGRISAEEIDRALMGRGFVHWVKSLLHHLNIGDAKADIDFLHKLLNEDGEDNFFRIDIDVDTDHRALDDASEQNINYLYNKGLAASYSKNFSLMLKRLKDGLAHNR